VMESGKEEEEEGGQRHVKLMDVVEQWPRVMLAVFAALPLVFSGLGMSRIELNDLQGWNVRNSRSSISFDSFVAALEEVDSVQETHGSAGIAVERSVESDLFFDLYFVSERDMLLHPEDLFFVRDFEREVLESEEMQQICLAQGAVCAPPVSVTAYLPENASDFDVMVFSSSLLPDFQTGRFSLSASSGLADALGPADLEIFYIRARIRLGLPLEGFADENDRPDQQQDLQRESLQQILVDFVIPRRNDAEFVQVFGDFPDITSFFAFRTLASDAIFAGGSMFVVFLCLSLHTSSVFLGGCGLFQILLSFPTTYFFYRVVFGIIHFGTLQTLAIYLLLGIGSDDIFIFYDAFRQSEVILGADSRSLSARLSWSFIRAAGAMFVTSFTTLAAFLIVATSQIINIRVFGIFAGMLVLVNYLLVISVFPCLIIIHEKHVKPFRTCLCCFARCFKCAHSPDTDPLSDRKDLPKIERWFRDKYIPNIMRFRFAIIGVFAILFGVFAFSASRFGPSTRRIEDIFPENHPVTIVNSLKVEEFTFASRAYLSAYIVFGLLPIDRRTASAFNPLERGTVRFEENFDLFANSSQRLLLNLCSNLKNESTLIRSDDEDAVECWIDSFQEDFLQDTNLSIPLFPESTARTELSKWIDIVPEFSSSFFGPVVEGGNLPDPIRFMLVEVVLSTLRSSALNKQLEAYENLENYLEELMLSNSSLGAPLVVSDDFVILNLQETLVRTALIGLFAGIGVGFIAMLAMTRNLRVTSLGILNITVVCVFVLGTMKFVGWDIGFMEAISITALVALSFDFSLHYCIAFVEFELKQVSVLAGVNEKDHFPGDYVTSPDSGEMVPSRKLITRCAYVRIGVSVLFGALTTFSAAIALLLCQIQYLAQFGAFLAMVISFSLLASTVLLPSLLSTLGPDFAFPFKDKSIEVQNTI